MNSYVPEESKVFDIPDGDYKVRILKVENTMSKSGLNMHAITLQVEGVKEHYLHFICEGEFYNKAMTTFFDAFKIPRGNFNFSYWLGKITAAHFEHRQRKFTGNDGLEHTANRCELVYFHKTLNSVQSQNPARSQDYAQNPAQQAPQTSYGAAPYQPEEMPADIPF